MDSHDDHGRHRERQPPAAARGRWAFIGFAAVAAFFLFTEHRAHLLGVLPYLLLLAAAWKVLYAAQQAHRLATKGPYARIHHPQYAGFVLIMAGFLQQWPTLVTLAMFPILVFMYVQLARREEREAEAGFGDEYRRYKARTPAFIPRRQAGETMVSKG